MNDLASMGARPLYLTAGFILETGLSTDVLEPIVRSMAETAREAGVTIVAGDTKVIEGKGGLYINTAGLGDRAPDCEISAGNLHDGDAILVTGTLGDHHAVILTERMQMKTTLASDCAPLNHLVEALLVAKLPVHTIRDITRGDWRPLPMSWQQPPAFPSRSLKRHCRSEKRSKRSPASLGLIH